MPYTLYLAGPLTGMPWSYATGWRNRLAFALGNEDFRCLSPLRLVPESGEEIPHVIPDDPLANQKAIVGRDFNDILRADLVIANTLGAEFASIGTVCEITFAYANRKPTILCYAEGSAHDHAFLKEMCAFHCHDSDDLPYLVRGILS